MSVAARKRLGFVVALVVGMLTTVLYVGILVSENEDPSIGSIAYLMAMVVAAASLVVGLAARRYERLAGGIAAALYLASGMLAIFSIGVLLLVAGVAALLAVAYEPESLTDPG